MFLVVPWLGCWFVKGNLNYSLTLGVLPLADPYVLMQSLVAGHGPEPNVLIGAAIIAYFLVSGRAAPTVRGCRMPPATGFWPFQQSRRTASL